jgi:hypothetical protein
MEEKLLVLEVKLGVHQSVGMVLSWSIGYGVPYTAVSHEQRGSAGGA